MRISATAICLVGIHAPLHGRRAGQLAAQIGDGEVVRRLRQPHVGRRQREEHVRPAGGGAEVDAARHQHLVLGHEHVLQQQRARDGAAHAERVPVAHHRHALGLGGNGEVERVAAAGGIALGALGAQDAVVVGRARQRGEDLLAADEEAAVHRLGLGAERRRTGRRRAALGEGLRVDGAVADDALVVQAAAAVVLGALLGAHLEVVGQRAGPQAWSTRACSRRAPWRRSSGRARRRPGSRCGSSRPRRPRPRARRCRAGPRRACRGSSRSGRWRRGRAGRRAAPARGRRSGAPCRSARASSVAQPEGGGIEDRRIAVVPVEVARVHGGQLLRVQAPAPGAGSRG